MIHNPVLTKEVLEYLDVRPNKNFIDCTIGEAGHTTAILEENGPGGKVLGIEVDPELYERIKKKNIKRLVLVNDSYTNLKKIVEEKRFGPVHGVLLDLGLSTWHLEKSRRGFSFMRDEPLNMRYHSENQKPKIKNQKDVLTAERILNTWSQKEIEKILRIYGEERFAKKIAKKIAKERQKKPIERTSQLVELVKRTVPKNYERGRIHPATRTFQALRITTNNELKNLHQALPQTLEILEKGGRLVVISFHSLEDRIVKYFFSASFKGFGGQASKIKILTKKLVRASEKEVKDNPRARSAKLRVAQKT